MVVGGWRVEYQGRQAWYSASTSLTDTNLQSFQVTAGGKVIASVSAASRTGRGPGMRRARAVL